VKSLRRVIQATFLGIVVLGVAWGDANCERWCPFGGVEAIYTYVAEGNMLCSLGVSNFFILGGVLVATLLVRRAFCGYMCPIGTISEGVRGLGRRMRLPLITVPPRVDRLLSWSKYVLLVVVLLLTYRAGELIFRGFDPCYALISRHGEDITYWAYVVSGAILLASLFMTMPFCRWLCPLAAVLNVFSRFGWARVKRDGEACRDCNACAQRCPMAIPVDKLPQVTVARCIACWECIAACPSTRSRPKALSWGTSLPTTRHWSQGVLVGALLFCTLGAVTASYLVPVPSYIRHRGEPPAETAVVELQVSDVTCRGRANLLAYFLERDDIDAVPGYLRIAAWPGPGWSRVQITYDPAQADGSLIQAAITNPIFEPDNNYVRTSPFEIEGYDPLQLDF
jgi:hypothetical protein